MLGTIITGAFGGFGKKLKVPNFTPINPDQVQADSISGNLSALPGAETLGGQTNAANARLLQQLMQFALPGGFEQAQSNITNQLKGVADIEDTQAAIRNATAAGFGSGTAGSQFGNLKVVGQLGRSVAEQRQQGLSNFVNFAQNVMPKPFDVSSMFFSPEQRLQAATSERDDMFKRNLLAAQTKVAPDPFLGGVTATSAKLESSL